VILFLTVPELLLKGFLSPDEPNKATIIAIGVGLLAIAALFQLVDAGQVMLLGLLRGAQDTKLPMWIAAFSYWGVGIPTSYLFGITLGWGAVGVWGGLVVGLGLTMVLLVARWRIILNGLRNA
jgi:MATE family multidrug resistance protein